MCWGSNTYTHAKAQEHQDAAVTGSTANGWPGLPLPGMKNIQGWGTVPHPAEDEPHVSPVQISESTQIPTVAHDRTCLFLHSQHQPGAFGWLERSSSVVSPIAASLPKKPGIMRDSSRQSLGSTTIPSTERKREANPSHLLLLTHLFKSTSVF